MFYYTFYIENIYYIFYGEKFLFLKLFRHIFIIYFYIEIYLLHILFRNIFIYYFTHTRNRAHAPAHIHKEIRKKENCFSPM